MELFGRAEAKGRRDSFFYSRIPPVWDPIFTVPCSYCWLAGCSHARTRVDSCCESLIVDSFAHVHVSVATTDFYAVCTFLGVHDPAYVHFSFLHPVFSPIPCSRNPYKLIKLFSEPVAGTFLPHNRAYKLCVITAPTRVALMTGRGGRPPSASSPRQGASSSPSSEPPLWPIM